MRRVVYVAGPVAASLFTIAPLGAFGFWLSLFVAGETALTAAAAQTGEPRAIEAGSEDYGPRLHLLRRIVPDLRARRPTPVREAQARWRRAAELRRMRLAS